MRTTFIAIWTLIALWIAFVVPFRVAFSGRQTRHPILKAWATIALYFVFVCLLLPPAVAAFDQDFARKEFHLWVPEGPAVVAMIFLGWIYPAVGYGLGALIRRFVKKA